MTSKEMFDKMLLENDEATSTEMMIEFAKYHVEKALKEVSSKIKLDMFTKGLYKGAKWIPLKDNQEYNPLERSLMTKVNKKSILNSYNLDNIK